MAEEKKTPRRSASPRKAASGSSPAKKPAARGKQGTSGSAAKATSAKAKSPGTRAAKPKAKATNAKAASAKAPAKRKPSSPAETRRPPLPEKSEAQPKAESSKRSKTSAEQFPTDHPTAPSLGPNTVIEREPVEERLARHEQSEVDAMGKDKRRTVVGQTYGPTFARQAALYGAFLAVVAVLAFGFVKLAQHADEPPASNPAKAPWATTPNVKQQPPKPLDFPRYGD